MSARAAGSIAVWLASLVPIVLAPIAGALGGMPRAMLAALPWIAWCSIPRTAGARDGAATATTLVALALPPIGLGLGVDLARANDATGPIAGACAAAACVALLAFAAEIARGTRFASAHAIASFALIALPLCAAVVARAGQPFHGGASRWLELASTASPLGWAATSLRADATSGPWPALAAAALLLALALAGARQRGHE